MASPICGPLFSITHSLSVLIAASVTSALEGRPSLASDSSTCVAQITGTCVLGQPQNLFALSERK